MVIETRLSDGHDQGLVRELPYRIEMVRRHRRRLVRMQPRGRPHAILRLRQPDGLAGVFRVRTDGDHLSDSDLPGALDGRGAVFSEPTVGEMKVRIEQARLGQRQAQAACALRVRARRWEASSISSSAGEATKIEE